MAVVITSTTSTQEQLDHATSENWRTPPEVKEPATDPVESKETVETETVPETVAPEEKKGKGGWSKRIDKLTAKNAALEKELSELRAKSQAENPSTETQPAARPIDSGKPQSGNFKTVEEYVEALVKWTQEQERAVDAQRQQNEMLRNNMDSYNARVSQLQGEVDDWDELVASSAIPLPVAVHTAIISMGEEGPDIAYHLAKNPEECQKLVDIMNERGDAAAVYALGRIAAKLLPSTENPPPVKQRPKPPAPIRTVGGSSTQSTVPLDQLPMREYMRVRNEQQRGRRH